MAGVTADRFLRGYTFMRTFRALLVTITALLLGGSLLAGVPAHADDRPTRAIEWTTTQKDWRTFQLKATVENLPDGKAVIEKKACGKCKWKKARKVKTNEKGVLKTKIFAPRTKGKWLWRVRINARDGYARSYSTRIGAILKG